MRNIRLILAYDGTRYRGWQRLAGADNTIQGKLEQTISRLLAEPVQVHGSGRTDAGVHALGQVANFHCQSAMPCPQILAGMGQDLPEDIGVLSCQEVHPRFHARLNALSKTYLYRVWNSTEPCVFQRRYVYRMPEALDTAAMEQAAAHLLGKHDFRAFSTGKSGKKSTLRTIYRLEIFREGPEVRFLVQGDGFLYNMVRIMVGTLLEAGLGRKQDIPEIFAAGRREAAGYTVPASGLFLQEVTYP